jgi:hypothetical protein
MPRRFIHVELGSPDSGCRYRAAGLDNDLAAGQFLRETAQWRLAVDVSGGVKYRCLAFGNRYDGGDESATSK